MGKCFFIRTSPVLVFYILHYNTHPYPHLHTYTCYTCILTRALHLLHLAAFALPLTLGYVYSVHVVVQVWWKCQCVSVSVEVSVFKGFSGRTLRNAFGKKESVPHDLWFRHRVASSSLERLVSVELRCHSSGISY